MSRNDVILGAAALVLVVFSLVVSLVVPRRDPGFPGRNIKMFTAVSLLLVVAMLAAVEVFGAEHAGDEEHAEAAETETGGETGEGGAPAEGDPAAGEAVYASAGCGSCHVLEDAGSSGTVGPSLDDSTIAFDAAVTQITEGGNGMPPFGDSLSEEEIRDVAAFVVASQG